jgi:transcriptional regulator with XRE-family HTH domain
VLRPKREPSVLARLLAVELRRYRDVEQLTGEEAATRLGWSASKISRIENALIVVETDDLLHMLEMYQVSGSERDRLIELARSADEYRRGWWDAYADTLGQGYSAMIALEAAAEAERTFVPTLVPGLLQTEAYARAIIGSSLVPTSEEQVRQRIQVRMKRQRELIKDGSLVLSVVIDEAALLRQIGGPDAMREQLAYLVEMANRENSTLQVLPLAKGSHPAITGGFTILEFPGVIATKVVYLENMTSELFIVNPDEVSLYSNSFDILREVALAQDDSVSLITRIAGQLN